MKRFVVLVLIALVLSSGCSAFLSQQSAPAPVGTNMPSSVPVQPQQQQAQREQEADVLVEEMAAGEAVADNAVGMIAPAPASVAMAAPTMGAASAAEPPADMSFENYGVNPSISTDDDHLSTFAMDVDTASYTLARSYLRDQNQLPPPDAIRSEEFINYFDAEYAGPEDDSAFAIHLDVAPAPFGAEDELLMRVGIQGRYVRPEDRPPTLLIFVIDVSGSMSGEERLGLVKESLGLLVNELREDDRIGIVVYSDNSRVVLPPTSLAERNTIVDAINRLQTEGSTNAEAGLVLGYGLAEDHMREVEMTRIILCSDGVANVGNTGPDAILQRIRQQVEAGVTLTSVGFGMGNFNDVLMEQLANDGNGSYFYVDNLREARRVFVHNLTSTLQVIGFNAKIQVDFNPEVVAEYRLIGYENRDIADEDFRNDTVDAGEVGAGHSITALYELTLKPNADEDTLATVYVRYEDADTREVEEINSALMVEDVHMTIEDTPANFRLLAAVGEFSELLRESPFAEGGTYGAVVRMVEPLAGEMGDDEAIAEFLELVRVAARVSDV